MAFQEISSTDHSLLLYRIDFLPYDEAQEIKAAFLKIYGEYMDQLFHLQKLCRDYELIADCVRLRVPLKESDHQLECLMRELA
ncbi:hypothetical protein HQ865_24860 [Mucilaginibacter mali]|uniref:Uncharacterized protein n=1 Tax=Mucilaginibacter mali TaxID=2740462 RepID=A0A7D4QXR0_9SPHI|nr:hypothetical protein [Mucilaginibacter mali]QKJ32849.1 hypothetical protein HQ865_24860 [Mucilaginibacter mali]